MSVNHLAKDSLDSQLSVKCVDCGNEILSFSQTEKVFDLLSRERESTRDCFAQTTTMAARKRSTLIWSFAVVFFVLVISVVQSRVTLQTDSDVQVTLKASTTSTASTASTSSTTSSSSTTSTASAPLTTPSISETVTEQASEVEEQQQSDFKVLGDGAAPHDHKNIFERGQIPGKGDDSIGPSEQTVRFDKSVFQRLYSRGKTKSLEEIVDQSVDKSPKVDENDIDHRQGRSNFKGRNVETVSGNGRTSDDILNEIVNFGLDQSRFLFDVQEKRIYDNGLSVKKNDPAHFVGVFNRQSQRAKDLSKYGYATLQASTLLSKQFTLTRQQIVYDLERVELRTTDLFNECPFNTKDKTDVLCTGLDLIYRSADGTCNNLDHPEWGSSFMPFLRFLPPDYSDGIQEFRVAQSGNPLPSPRAVSTMVHRESSDDTPPFTMMVMQWGQYLDHDLTSTPQTRGFNSSIVKCCSPDGKPLSEDLMHPDCAPIQIPPNDQFYSLHNVTCMEFIRSSPAPRKDCSLGPRDPINQVTSFIDASSIYGSTIEEQKALRLGRLGKLKYTDLHFRKPLLPALDPSTSHEMCRITSPNLHCFAAGDARANEQPGLTAMHTLWLREHNRIARELSTVNPHWEDERLFQEARKIVGSLVQHITYNEWLPVVLGKPVIDIFELKLKPTGYQRDYNATINPTLANAVATAAFRFGHSLVRNSLSRCTKDYKELPFFVKLHKEFNDPSNIHNLGSVDRLMLGLMSKSMAKRDEFIAAELTNHLFQHPNSDWGMDLVSLNVQRGRDHGIAPYNVWRGQCGLTRFERWSDMVVVANPETIDRLSSVYESVNDIDLFTGGMVEKPVRGGIVGPTFACILGQQFLNLKKGDRFWYENGGHPGSFRPDQLQEIRKTSLARVICDNLDNVDTVQPYVFLSNEEESNRRVPCRGSSIPHLNLGRWKEEPEDSKPTQFLATDSLLSKLGPDQAFTLQDLEQFNDKDFESLPETRQPPEVEDEAFGPFVDEVPRPLAENQFFDFFGDEKDLSESPILQLFEKEGRMRDRRR